MEKMKRIAKILETVCRILAGVLLAAAVIGAAAFLALFFVDPNLLIGAENTLELGGYAFALAEGLAPENLRLALRGAFLLLVIAGLACVFILRVLSRIFASLREGDVFCRNVSRDIRRIAWVVLVGGAVAEAVQIISSIVTYRAFRMDTLFLNENITACTVRGTSDFSFLGFFAVILLLSYVFQYGEELQKQSDETL